MCLHAPECAHAHICQRQMWLHAPKGAHAHIYQMQMCLEEPIKNYIIYNFYHPLIPKTINLKNNLYK